MPSQARDASPIEDYLHTLSRIYSERGPERHEDAHSDCYRFNQDRILLDAVAQLLVFRSGESATVSTWITPRSVDIYWAKDERVTKFKELNYIRKIFVLANQDGPKHTPSVLWSMVVTNCKLQIVSRCRNFARQFGFQFAHAHLQKAPSGLWPEDRACYDMQSLRADFKVGGMMTESDNINKVLDHFIWTAGKLREESNEFVMKAMLKTAFILNGEPRRKFSGLHSGELSELNKLARYGLAIVGGSRWCRHYRRRGLCLNVNQVSSPDPTEINVTNNLIEVLNRRAMVTQAKALKRSRCLLKKFPDASISSDTSKIITAQVTQHPEMTVLLKMLQLMSSSGGFKKPIAIGTSEVCCYWCDVYMREVSARLAPLNFRQGRRTMVSNWALPAVAGGKTNGLMDDPVTKLVDDVFRLFSKSRGMGKRIDGSDEKHQKGRGGSLLQWELKWTRSF